MKFQVEEESIPCFEAGRTNSLRALDLFIHKKAFLERREAKRKDSPNSTKKLANVGFNSQLATHHFTLQQYHQLQFISTQQLANECI